MSVSMGVRGLVMRAGEVFSPRLLSSSLMLMAAILRADSPEADFCSYQVFEYQ